MSVKATGERTTPELSNTTGIENVAGLDGRSPSPSGEVDLYRDSGAAIVSEANFAAPSVLLRDISGQLGQGGKAKVIPLQRLHRCLADPRMGKDERFTEDVSFNVRFYGSWFPKKTNAQFEKANRILDRRGESPSFQMMVLERNYALDAERATSWMIDGAKRWLDDDGKSVDDFIAQVGSLFRAWEERLSPDQLSAINAAFRPIYEIISADEFRWNMGFMSRFFIMSGIAECSGLEGRSRERRPDLSSEFLSRSSGDVLNDLKDILLHADEAFEPEVADRVWDFFVSSVGELHVERDYWSSMQYFLKKNTSYIAEFINEHDRLLASFEGEDTEYGAASPFYLQNIYVELLTAGVVPEGDRMAALLRVLEDSAVHEGYGHLREYAKAEGLEDLEAKFMRDYLMVEAADEQSQRYREFYPRAMVEVGSHIFEAKAKEWGAEKTMEWMRSNLPEDMAEHLDLTYDILRLLLDKSPEVARKFLNQLKDPEAVRRAGLYKDPLWNEVGRTLSDSGMFLSSYNVFSMSDVTKGSIYRNLLLEIPEYLNEIGLGDLLKDFYLANNSYAELYSAPSHLRPTGRGLTYMTLDLFPDLSKEGHPDKDDVAVTMIEDSVWAKEDRDYHGIGTSALAVGRTLGLAPDADLHVIPFPEDGDASFPKTVLAGLKKVRDARLADPNIAVVGLSMGLEIPHAFRSRVRGSGIYKELKAVCKELHELGVAVIVSAGNDGSKDHVNMLGYLPHVKLVGAVNSGYTPSRSDDVESKYSTGGDGANPVSFWAHADPVVSPIGGSGYEWILRGGTSSAQPFVSAAILLMKEVNPTLTPDDCYRILDETSDPLADSDAARGIDPAEAIISAGRLPGSTYTSERLDALEELWGSGRGTEDSSE